MPTLRNRDYLNSRFETGDIPTEEDFQDLIFSCNNRVDDSIGAGVQVGFIRELLSASNDNTNTTFIPISPTASRLNLIELSFDQIVGPVAYNQAGISPRIYEVRIRHYTSVPRPGYSNSNAYPGYRSRLIINWGDWIIESNRRHANNSDRIYFDIDQAPLDPPLLLEGANFLQFRIMGNFRNPGADNNSLLIWRLHLE